MEDQMKRFLISVGVGVLLELVVMYPIIEPPHPRVMVFIGPAIIGSMDSHHHRYGKFEGPGVYPTLYFWDPLSGPFIDIDPAETYPKSLTIVFVIQSVFWSAVIYVLLTLMHFLQIPLRRLRTARNPAMVS